MFDNYIYMNPTPATTTHAPLPPGLSSKMSLVLSVFILIINKFEY